MRYTTMRYIIALSLYLALAACQSEAPDILVKSPADKRQYAYHTLDNGAQVFVVSDPTLTYATAAVSVRVGNFQNPANRPGVAHFLEHLLFLGSDKYPLPGEYFAFIEQNGGSANAMTSNQFTTYYFNIDPGFFPEALERLSRFFIAPLFLPNSVEKECMIVDAEYKRGLLEEGRRVLAVEKATANPLHPFHQFQVGSRMSLQGPDGQCDRAAVIDLYHQYYRGDRMKVVLVAPDSTETLMAQAKAVFQALPSPMPRAEVVLEPLVYTPKEMGQTIYIQSQGPRQELVLQFPLTDIEDAVDNAGFLMRTLLNMESKGSLAAALKSEGLIESLSANIQTLSDRQDKLYIAFQLRTVSPEVIETITTTTFAYLQFLEQSDVQAKMFERIQRRSSRNFRFQDPRYPESLALDIAEDLHTIPVVKILSDGYLLEDARFDAPAFQAILEQCRPDNLRRIVLSQAVEADKVEPYYQVPYHTEPFALSQIVAWRAAMGDNRFYALSDNPYEPTEFQRRPVLYPKAAPRRTEVGRHVLWHATDQRANAPYAWARILLRSSDISNTPKAAVLNQLWITNFYKTETQLMERIGEAQGTGGIYFSKEGLIFEIDGYRDVQRKIWLPLVEAIVSFEPTEETFNALKAQLMRAVEANMQTSGSLEDAALAMNALLSEQNWLLVDLYEALKTATWAEVAAHRAQVLQSGTLEALFYGNLSLEDARRAMWDIDRVWKLGGQAEPKLDFSIQTPPGHWYRSVSAHGPQQGSIVYLQALEDTIQNRVNLSLFAKLLHGRFFEQLRTKEQLGYVVNIRYVFGHWPGVSFAVESGKKGEEITQRSFQFIETIPALLAQLSTEEWEAVHTSFVRDLERPMVRPETSLGHYWHYIATGRPFSEEAAVLAQLKATTQASFTADIQAWLPKAPKIVVDTGHIVPRGYTPLSEPYAFSGKGATQ